MPATLQNYLKIAQSGSGHPRLVPYLTGATIKKGDLCVLDSNGRLNPAVALGTAAEAFTAYPTTMTRLCIADQNVASSTATDTLVQVYFVDDDTQLEMIVTNGGAAVAFPSPFTFRGKQCNLYRNTAGVWVVDEASTTYTPVEIIDYVPATSGDTYWTALVRPVFTSYGSSATAFGSYWLR
jgi:hypothetical protein